MELKIDATKNAVITISLITLLFILYIGFSYYLMSVRVLANKQFGKDDEEKKTINHSTQDNNKIKRKYRKRKK